MNLRELYFLVQDKIISGDAIIGPSSDGECLIIDIEEELDEQQHLLMVGRGWKANDNRCRYWKYA